MSDFKIGDRVRVTDGAAAYDEYFADVLTGAEGSVTGIWPDESVCPIGVSFDNDDLWNMAGQHLEHIGDPVEHPVHYTSHPSGIECITITEHMGFTLGNAVKYIWRADLKSDAVEDLKKAKWYIDRELSKRGAA